MFEHLTEVIIGALAFLGGIVSTWITSNVRKDTTKNENESAERMHLLDKLTERVEMLEKHNHEQDDQINRLIIENANLRAQNTILLEQNRALREEIKELREELKNGN